MGERQTLLRTTVVMIRGRYDHTHPELTRNIEEGEINFSAES